MIISSLFSAFASAMFVMSSKVGPNPPVDIIIFADFMASLNISLTTAISSGMVMILSTFMPSSVNFLASQVAFVFTVLPINSSFPIDMIQAFIP